MKEKALAVQQTLTRLSTPDPTKQYICCVRGELRDLVEALESRVLAGGVNKIGIFELLWDVQTFLEEWKAVELIQTLDKLDGLTLKELLC